MDEMQRYALLQDRLVSGQRDRVAEQAEATARRLERMAEEVRRHAQLDRVSLVPERVASDIIHEVTWGVANLNLDGLVKAVADYNAVLAAARAVSGAPVS